MKQQVVEKLLGAVWIVAVFGILGAVGGVECGTMTIGAGATALILYAAIMWVSYILCRAWIRHMEKPRPVTKAMRKRVRRQRRKRNQTRIDDVLTIAGILLLIALEVAGKCVLGHAVGGESVKLAK